MSGLEKQINKISTKLSEILEKDSDEKVMVFTDNKAVIELSRQINELLCERQKMKADFRRQELHKKKMLSNISHDIKTPLTVILGYLEIMRMENAGDETLQKVEARAKQVMELINQFFTLAKLEAGDQNLQRVKVNICEVCRENILSFYELLRQKEFTVDIGIPEHALFAWGDTDAIHRILSNLISNAVRYGSEGNYIGMFVRKEADAVIIEITDKGKGIEKAFAERVFERLYTLEVSRNRDFQGNGLVLTIARNLARQMGGELSLKSEPHVKTTFTVKLNCVLN